MGLTALAAFGLTVWAGSRGFFPFDESIVFDGGYRVLLGQAPHRDFITSFGPVTYWMQAAFFRLFGVRLMACVWAAAASNVAAALAARGIARLLFPGRESIVLVAGLLTAVWFYPPMGFLWFEQTAFLLLLVGLLLTLWTRLGTGAARAPLARRAALLVAGGCATLSFVARQNIGVFAPPAFLLVAATDHARRPLDRVRDAGWLAAGAAAATAVFGVWLLCESDWRAFVEQVFLLPGRLGGSRLSRNWWRTLAAFAYGKGPLDIKILEATAVAVAVAAFLRMRAAVADAEVRSRIEAALLLAVGCFTVQNLVAFTTLNNPENGFPFIGLILTAAFGLALEAHRAAGASARNRAARVAALAALACSLYLGARGVRAAVDRVTLDIFEGSTFGARLDYEGLADMRWGLPTRIVSPAHPEEMPVDLRAEDVVELLRWLRVTNRPFFVFPDFTALYGLAGVAPPQPLLFFAPGQTYDEQDTAILDRRIVDALERAGVETIVVERVSWFGTARRLRDFPRLTAYIEGNFSETRTIGLFSVRERVDMQDALGASMSSAEDAAASGTAAGRLRAFVGGPARLTWIRQVEGGGDDPFCWGDRLVIMGLDTDDGRGERPLTRTIGSYHRPMLTADGRRVVFTRFRTREAYVLDWDDDKPPRFIGDGYAAAVWSDPATSNTWVYLAATGDDGWDRHSASTLHRVRLDDPAVREPVWDRTRFTIDNVQLSADGKRFCAQFPHPRAGFAIAPNVSWTMLGRGCWTSMAPDDSYLVWVFDGPHRNVTIHSPETETSWPVRMNTAPGMDGFEVYHPRWSNRLGFFVLTGPYKTGKAGGNLIGAGGGAVEVHVGRFAADMRSVEDWLRVTHNDLGDFYPDLWIDPAVVAPRQAEPTTAPTATDSPRVRRAVRDWPPGAVVLWEDANGRNETRDADGAADQWDVRTHGRAFWGPHGEMELRGGHFIVENAGVRLAAAARTAADFTLEVVAAPDARQTTSAGCVMAFGEGIAKAHWAIEQADGNLRFRLRTSVRGPEEDGTWTAFMGAVRRGRPAHLAVRLAAGALTIWRDGEVVSRTAVKGDLSAWGHDPLSVGSDAAGRAAWRGGVWDLAFYRRALTDAEVVRSSADARARIDARTAPPEEHVVDVRLLAAVPPPDPASILPYRRALVAQEYAVEKSVAEAGLAAGDKIAIAHWAVLDGRMVPTAEAGSVRAMRIALFDARPPLESERLFLDPDLMDLPLFYESDVE